MKKGMFTDYYDNLSSKHDENRIVLIILLNNIFGFNYKSPNKI